MSAIVNIQLDLMFIILLILILLHANKSRYASEQQERRLYNLHLCSVLVCVVIEGVTWFVEGRLVFDSIATAYVFNVLGFLTNPLPAFTWLMYVNKKLGSPAKAMPLIRPLSVAIIALNTALSLLNPFTDWFFTLDAAGNYFRSYGFASIYLFILIFIFLSVMLPVRALKRQQMNPEERRYVRLMIFYPLVPVVGLVIQFCFSGMSTALMGMVIAVSISYIYDTLFRLEKMYRLEKELDQSRVAIMMSQIKPHFLYNVLVTIQDICYTDPDLAAEAVGEFAVYLRGNLDSITESALIPFTRELQHVENYLALEKKRFEERLNIRYELKVTDFALPAMTLQPIVENAVRHGVTKRKEGGTVTVKTYEAHGAVFIEIIDDGVGMDAAREEPDGRTHIGIENVRKRLKNMCGGTLEIEGTLGIGTVVRLTIPRRG